MTSDENGIRAVGAYYAADHQYRCEMCGKAVQRGGKVHHEYDETYIETKCKCGKTIRLIYGRR